MAAAGLASPAGGRLNSYGKVVGWCGVASGAACAVLLSVTAGVQAFGGASKEVNGTTCTVAELGIFSASYMPACAGLPGSAIDVSLVDFWPLFPAQASPPYGNVSEAQQFGLGSTPFTNCSAYMALSTQEVLDTTVGMVSAGLESVVPELFDAYSSLLAAPSGAALGRLGYNATDFQDNQFLLIRAGIAIKAPYLSNINQLVVNVCKGNSAVATQSDCARAVAAVIAVPVAPLSFASPVGGVYGNFSAYLADLVTALQGLATQASDGNQTQMLGEAQAQVSTLQRLTAGCVSLGAVNVSSCALLAGVPSNGSEPYVLSALLGAPSGSFIQFSATVVAVAKAGLLPASFAQLLPAAQAVVACAARGETDAQSCLAGSIGLGVAAQLFSAFYPHLNATVPQAALNGSATPPLASFVQNLTAQCESGDQSIQAVQQAQTLLIAATACAWFGAVLATAAVAVGRARAPALPGLVMLAAAVLAIVALMGAKNAPAFSAVGECVTGEMCYEMRWGAVTGIIGFALALTAALLLVTTPWYVVNLPPAREPAKTVSDVTVNMTHNERNAARSFIIDAFALHKRTPEVATQADEAPEEAKAEQTALQQV
jgi:hypothetical protein